MLKQGDPNQGLLNNKNDVNKTNYSRKSNISQDQDDGEISKSSKKKNKTKRSQLTYILKFLNIIVGLIFIAFAIFCYSFGFNQKEQFSKALALKYVMPAYIGLSGVIILLIQCRIGFVIKNLRFFYNYFGRGIFNIYAGIMPLTLISDFNKLDTFQILAIVSSSIMCLVGVLYVSLKIFCCQKEGDIIDKQNNDSD